MDTVKLSNSEAQKKKEHEEQEAQRKAEWEAKQNAKKEELFMQWETAVCLSDDQLIQAATAHIDTGTEILTRRNMKICVSEHIQNKCALDLNLARHSLHPQKSMVNCFRYITRMAKDYIKQEMEANNEQALGGGYGSDVPDQLCYKWAEDYFLDLDAPEDLAKEEKFVPKPYSASSKSKKSTSKKSAPTIQENQPTILEAIPNQAEQLSLLEQMAGGE